MKTLLLVSNTLTPIHRQFVSPILFPDSLRTLPASISAISPITSSAHPSIHNLSCALLHPSDPSCLRTYLNFYLTSFPSLAKFLSIIYGLLALARFRKIIENPVGEINGLAKRVLRLSMFISAAIGTSWGSICLFQSILPHAFLPTQRWFWGGFLGGMWGFLERESGKSQFLYVTRLSIDSFWKVGIKRRWWREGRNGDVWVFVASLMVLNVVYEIRPEAVRSGLFRRGGSFLRGEGWGDKVKEEEKKRRMDEGTND